MKFIRQALIGIALYEAGKYFLKSEAGKALCAEFTLARPTYTPDINVILAVGSDPEAALGGHGENENQDDPWKKTLADGELRAPDA